MCRAQTPSEALLASGSGRREGHEGDQGPLRVDGGPSFIVRKSPAVGGGCVKTLKRQQGRELFSLLPFFQSQPQRYSSLD